MIRIRSQKLLSGVSTLAVLASLGVVSPALADQTVSGAGLFAPITNAGADDFILVDTGATIDVNGSGHSIINSGTLTNATDAIDINAANLLGNIWNSGTVNSTGEDGIQLQAGAVVVGAIINTGTGQILGGAGDQGIEILNAVLAGGIQNNGAASQIIGATDGIQLIGNSVLGNALLANSIINSGTIAGTAGDGISVDDVDIDIKGDITNNATGTISAAGAGNVAINLNLFSEFTGDIANSGLITSPGATGVGIFFNTGTMTGDISNSSTGDIIASAAAGRAIAIQGGTIAGDIVNGGSIAGGQNGIHMFGGLLTGDIQNNAGGVISSTTGGRAIHIAAGTIAGGIVNAGQILANGGNTSTAINLGVAGTIAGGIVNTGVIDSSLLNSKGIVLLDGAVFTGGIQNNGTAAVIQAGDTAIFIDMAVFAGDITNTGTIDSNDADAILITSATSFTGNITSGGRINALGNGIYFNAVTADFNGTITNGAGGVIDAGGDGINVIALSFDGDVVNDGTIASGADGIELDVATFTGDVTNSGLIGNTGTLYVGGDGMSIDGTTLTGSVVNDGSIYAAGDGIIIESGLTVSGDVTNTGTIFGDAINGGAGSGIDIQGIVSGALNNTGLISAEGTSGGTAVKVDGTLTGGLTNSGRILGSDKAINLSGANTGTTVTQSAGLIRGNNDGTITTALDLTNTFNDTFNGNGGTLDGNVLADASDDFVMTPGSSFVYLRGTASGLDTFNKAGAGTAILGASERGGQETDTLSVTAASMTFTAGNLYIDNNAVLNLTDYTQSSTGNLEFFLTADTTPGAYGTIELATGFVLGNATNAAVYIDPLTFNAGGLGTSFVYDKVLDGGESATGAFANAATITTSSVFFTGAVVADGVNDFDIELTRLSFAEALALVTVGGSTNDIALGAAIDTIYDGGEMSTEFEDLIASLFAAGATPEEIQAILDDISGAEHAQNQQMALNVTGQFNEFLGMRLDATLGSSTGGGMASLFGQQYADAETTATDAGTAPRSGGSHGLNRGPSGVSVWLRGFGQWVNVDADPNAAGYDQDTNGAAGGIDYAVSNNATIGVAGSWSKTESEFDTAGDSSEMDSWAAGAYGSVGFGRMYVDGLASYASHDVSTLRTVLAPVPGAPFVAASDYNATAWSAQGEFGMIFGLGRANIQPSVGLSYIDLTTDAFIETGDGGVFNLIVDEANAQSLASTLALRMSGEWKMGRTRVMPEIRVGWRHEFENDPHSFTAAFDEDPATTFTIVSSEIQQDSAVVRAGATFGVTRNIEVFVNLNGQYSSDAAATNGSGGLRLTW